jgi:hypothetical protein
VLIGQFTAMRLIIPASVAYDAGSAQANPSIGDHGAPQVAGRNVSDEQGDTEEAARDERRLAIRGGRHEMFWPAF